MENIRLSSTDSVFSSNKENITHVQLNQTTKKISLTDIRTIIDQYDVYRKEVADCENYRITLTMKPYCTNVLFNTCTEIVKDEGSDRIEVALDGEFSGLHRLSQLNEDPETHIPHGKRDGLTREYMVQNTEYSSEKINIAYFPGFDIFGNHILRNLSFRSVIPLKITPSQGDPKYNTLDDDMRDTEGNTITGFRRKIVGGVDGLPIVPLAPAKLKLYRPLDVLNMLDNESADANLTNDNGWYGFKNNSCIEPKRITFQNASTTNNILVDKVFVEDSGHVLNNRGNCEFIDMYPDRSLFSFTPKYNKFRHRLEKNWDVWLTYPYSNFYRHNIVTNAFIFPSDNNSPQENECDDDALTNALYIFQAVPQKGRNGMKGVQFRTLCKHNLKANDNVVIYYSLDNGVSYVQCEDTFHINYVGNVKNEKQDYYFTINNSPILDEIFTGRIEETFYQVLDEDSLTPDEYREISGPLTELPQNITDENQLYIPNIKQWFYSEMDSEPITNWNSGNTVDIVQQELAGENMSYDYLRQRKKENGEYVYEYYVWNEQTFGYLQVEENFDPAYHTFGSGNTFDEVPLSYISEYIRVHRYNYWKKTSRFLIQNVENVEGKIAQLLCHEIQLRFTKIVNGEKCEYYIRKFKKIPNLNHVPEKLTEEVASNRKRFDEYVVRNATVNGKMRNYDCETYPLAFSKTIYGDDITQYQYTENFKLTKLRDNLNRPLTEIYATVIKKNVGYKQWYLERSFCDGMYGDGTKYRVEFSHCFGKVLSGFEFMGESFDDEDDVLEVKRRLSDVSLISSVTADDTMAAKNGYSIEWFENNEEIEGIVEDDEEFFGDIVEYNPTTVTETVLSDVHFRFNTAQRENANTDDYHFTYSEIIADSYNENLKVVMYEDGSIIQVANDSDTGTKDIESGKNAPIRSLTCPEGYHYKAHNQIKIREFSKDLHRDSHYSVRVISAEPVQLDGIFIKIKTYGKHTFSIGNKVFICDDANGIWYNSMITYVDSNTSFEIAPISKDVETYEGKPYLDWIQVCDLLNEGKLKIRVQNHNIPDYARMTSTNLFLWRDIIPASESENDELNQYPFANNALYIDRCINFYLQRQDPEGVNGLYYNLDFPDIPGKIRKESNYEYIPESENIC